MSPTSLPQSLFANATPRVAVGAELVRQLDGIRAAVRRLHRREFGAWPDTANYLGDWLCLPLIGGPGMTPGQMRLPRTAHVLRTLGATRAWLSRIDPGCHILAHAAALPSDRVQIEVGLQVPAGSFFRDNDRWQQWPDGLTTRTRDFTPESVNYGREPRLMLVAEFPI